ncbi:hypothetical protein PVMG_05739 [Plasmodium vivax Mauritania I]|uniref:Variable surface protein n=1 Tax=Plasmodium vivax Mauritania I TaxID=1035515 RepID=A0A0J9T7E7_PLAVI|nr:hypothetical protein PVMG_05739 [Plasmodium vivax Mauritania I]
MISLFIVFTTKIDIMFLYKFFENIKEYLDAVKSSEKDNTQHEVSTECTKMSTAFYGKKKPEVAKSICEIFLKLYKSLNNFVSKDKTDLNYLSATCFLNYWLNAELKKKLFNENVSVQDFYDDLENYALLMNTINFRTIDEIYIIKNDDLENMNILYNLYTNYYNVFNGRNIVCTTKDTCLEYSRQCVQEYKKGIIKCKTNDSEFCKAIKEFQNKYDILIGDNKTKNGFSTSELKSLPSHAEVLQEYGSELNRRKITIVTISILCSIFGIILILFYLYKVQIN